MVAWWRGDVWCSGVWSVACMWLGKGGAMYDRASVSFERFQRDGAGRLCAFKLHVKVL